MVLRVSNNSALCLPLEEACRQFELQASWHGLKHLKRCLDISTTVQHSGVPNNCTLELYRLEKERVPSSVRIALLLPGGDRLVGVHSASSSLWEVISAAETEAGTTASLCYPGGDPPAVPCLEYAKVRVIGEEELKTKSLSNLGILSGSAVLRYSSISTQEVSKTIVQDVTVLKGHLSQMSRAPDAVTSKPADNEPQSHSTEDAMFPSPHTSLLGGPSPQDPYLSSVMKTPWSFDQQLEDERKRKQEKERDQHRLFSNPDGWEYDKGPFENMNLQAILTQALIPSVPPEEDYIAQFNALHSERNGVEPVQSGYPVPLVAPVPTPHTTPPERVYEEPCPRDTCVYHLDKNEYSDVNPAEIEDAFFQPSMSEVMARQADLTQELTHLINAPLSTQTYKKNQDTSKRDRYEKTVIRVVLPSRLVLQGVFGSGEPVRSLVSYIRSCFIDPTIKFHLFTAPPKKVIKNGRVTFKEASLAPACHVYLALDEEAEGLLLREELLEQVSTQLEADVKSARERGFLSQLTAANSIQDTPGSVAISQSSKTKRGKTSRANKGQGKPKWFKL